MQLSDVADLKVDFQPKTISFSGNASGTNYAFTIEMLHPINVADSKFVAGRSVVMTIAKGKEEWWATLSTTKLRFVKTDFARWRVK